MDPNHPPSGSDEAAASPPAAEHDAYVAAAPAAPTAAAEGATPEAVAAEPEARPARRRPRRRRGAAAEDAEAAAAVPAEATVVAEEGLSPDGKAPPVGAASAPPSLEAALELPRPEIPEESAEPDAPRAEALLAQAGRGPDEWLLPLGSRDLLAGEPVSPLRTSALPLSLTPAADEVFVPEALDETPPSPLLDLPEAGVRSPASALPLLPVTPEILAEIRGVSPEEVARERAMAREAAREASRAKQGGRPPKAGTAKAGPPPAPAAPEPPVAVPVPVVAQGPVPDLIVVQEALLETVPPEWVEEDPLAPVEAVATPATDDDARGGRRRRRRGRDREKPATPLAAEAAPVSLAPPAPVPTVTLLRASEDDVLRPERRDREAPREVREYKEILINVDERETRIAVLENGRLVELHVEREERVVGNVCKARVANVLQGMDAAFVDIGLDRNAFLYVGDILYEDPNRGGDGETPPRRTSRDVRIKDLAKPGQEILVQVVKGPRGTKGARVSTKISIPGRYLVLMPEGDHLGVSRKIDDAKERDRLKKIADQLQPKGFGLIVRTEAEGRTEQELRQDLEYLQKSWQRIVEKNKSMRAPALIHKDLGVILKTIRDLFGSDVDKLVIDSREEYEKIVDTLEELAPDLVDRVVLHDDPQPLFLKYNLEDEIDKLLRRKIWLRNGAYLLLDTTEALTTIDVNTGKFVGTSSLAETILKTNLDAVDEIARQLRLRDIGGMIVLDFIDMASSRDRQLVMRALENAFKKDRTRTKIAHISPLGLVEMTRKRTSESVTDLMSQTCPYCQGRGKVWSPDTIAIQIEREILRLCASRGEVDALLVHASPEVAEALIGPEGEGVDRLERMIRRPVYVRAEADMHIEKYEVLPADMLEMEEQLLPFHGGQVVECRVVKSELITPPRSAAWVDGYFVDLANAVKFQGQRIKARLTDVRRSFALGEPVPPSTSVDRSEPI